MVSPVRKIKTRSAINRLNIMMIDNNLDGDRLNLVNALRGNQRSRSLNGPFC